MAISDVHDAFRGKYGMSESRDLALRIIEKSKVTSAAKLVELSEGRLTLRTAQRSLTELKDEGVIEKRAGAYRLTGRTLDEVAVKRGSAGAAERQRRQHEYERERHAEFLLMGKRGKSGRLVTVARPDADVESEGVGVSEPVVILSDDMVCWLSGFSPPGGWRQLDPCAYSSLFDEDVQRWGLVENRV